MFTKEVDPLMQQIYTATNHRSFLLEELERLGNLKFQDNNALIREVQTELNTISKRLRNLFVQQGDYYEAKQQNTIATPPATSRFSKVGPSTSSSASVTNFTPMSSHSTTEGNNNEDQYDFYDADYADP